jgi:deoxyribonuclease-4
MRAIPHATETCPILLETPAGQGTEVLTDFDEFLDFVTSFKDPRLRICVDTCHVFATGYEPKDYAEGILIRRPDLLTLVHFNDSSTPCGSCVDRHAFIGTGDIGLAKLTEIAELCTKYKVPMVIE